MKLHYKTVYETAIMITSEVTASNIKRRWGAKNGKSDNIIRNNTDEENKELVSKETSMVS